MSNKFEIVVSAVDKASKPLTQINRNMTKLFRPVQQLQRASGNLAKNLHVDKLGRGLSGFAKMTDAMGVSSPIIKMLGAGAGVAGISAMMAQLLGGMGRWGTGVSRMSARTGIDMRELQRLQGAGRRSGVGADAVDSGLRNLGGTLEDALYGRNVPAAMLLKTLGVSVGKTASGAPDTARAFSDIAEAISKIANPEVQNKVASQLGMESLLPMLVKGRDALKDMGDQAERAGEVMGKASVDGAEKFARSLDRLKSNAEAVGRTMADKVTPAATSIVDGINSRLEGRQIDPAVKRRNHELLRQRGSNWLWNTLFGKPEVGAQSATGRVVDEAGNSSGPLGFRLNNPGNLKNVGGNGFQRFDNMLDGTRAMANQLLLYYNRDGLRDLNGIIGKYAPPNENKTAEYISDASKKTGITPSQDVNLNDPSSLLAVMKAMISHEIGTASNQLDPKVLTQAVYEALHRAPLQTKASGHTGFRSPVVATSLPIGMP